MVRGSCLCGTVAWRATAPLENMSHCHCAMCRKAHGAAFATYASVSRDAFEWLSGAGEAASYESSPGFHRAFCRHCALLAGFS